MLNPGGAGASRRFALAPVGFLLLWSGGFTVGTIGVRHAEPLTLLVLRYELALAALAPFYVWLRPALQRRSIEWLLLAVVGFLIQVVYFGLNYFAFAHAVPAGTVALITSLQPIFVAILAPPICSASR